MIVLDSNDRSVVNSIGYDFQLNLSVTVCNSSIDPTLNSNVIEVLGSIKTKSVPVLVTHLNMVEEILYRNSFINFYSIEVNSGTTGGWQNTEHRSIHLTDLES